ncbi:hypothetical protein KIN20_022198 [Parelaphostrongylus tenuis]|uniref:Uncharacterized protein n=1 Tax=Parelaphostrongylus tenuis TaxID=148309 RepID=A0AAD5QV83_PARTN|nr:hypothetical protein KIN20_022198 [Parelaphostrongylus tenuis]
MKPGYCYSGTMRYPLQSALQDWANPPDDWPANNTFKRRSYLPLIAFSTNLMDGEQVYIPGDPCVNGQECSVGADRGMCENGLCVISMTY